MKKTKIFRLGILLLVLAIAIGLLFLIRLQDDRPRRDDATYHIVRGTIMVGSTQYISHDENMVRISISYCQPPLDFVPSGEIVILRTIDPKVAALLPGDMATFYCRSHSQDFAAGAIGRVTTCDELDCCQMVWPTVWP